MNFKKIPTNRIRKLRTLTLGKEEYTFHDLKNGSSKELIDLCSNDYFGLSRDKDIINAAYSLTLKEGLGSGSSRFISGSRPIHELLERQLSVWLNQEKVLLFPSGFQANIAAIETLADRNTIIIADRLIHNSLLVGAKTSGSKLIRFLHNDLNDLEKKLSKFTILKKSILVVVESLYSMEGSIAPITEISRICKRYNVQLLVDEAHALGILGQEGKGLCNKLTNDVTMISGTLGKSFGSGGAFLACNSKIANQIIQTCGAFRYTTALAPSLAAGALKALEKIKINKSWGKDLIRISDKWKNEISKLDKYSIKGDCQILSIIIGDEDKTMDMQKYLEDNGFLAIGIRPPTVPHGQSRIRITIRRTLNNTILEKFISALQNF
tara:strand:- start:1581 stop:2720 length:1140 start_codon:yes stop_codon:yes gene_type:complete